MENLQVSLLDMQTYFEDRMTKYEADLQKKEDFSTFKNFILQTFKIFSQQLEKVARDVDNGEMRSRRKMLLVHGVEEQKGEETVQVVTELVKKCLKMDTFNAGDIRRCHRMGRQSSSDKPRPILIKLESTAVRDSLWFAKTKLKETGVTLSEFLTRSRHDVFMAAREKIGIAKAWTAKGYIYVLGADGLRHSVTSLGELNKIKCADTEKTVPKPTAAKSKRTAVATKK